MRAFLGYTTLTNIYFALKNCLVDELSDSSTIVDKTLAVPSPVRHARVTSLLFHMFSGILIGSAVLAQLCCSRYSCHFLLVKATTNYQCSTLLTSARFHWHQPSGDVDLPQSLLTHTSQHPNCLSIGSSVPDFHVPIVEPPVSHTAIYYWHISRLASRRDSAERQSSFQIIMFWDQLRPRDVAYHYLTAFLV